MNNEIEVGEFVRTKKGQIDIFEGTDENYMFARCKNKTYWKLDIVKHSKIKSEIVEVGDYVNGYKVIEVTKHTFTTMEQGGYKVHHKECVTIKSLLTKEAFKEREYVF